MSALFIAGAHTDVGKTHVACALIATARAAGLRVEALKPVMSGFDPARPEDSDAGRLLKALGREVSPRTLNELAPLCFPAPLAPPLAARRVGVRLTGDALQDPSKAWLRSQSSDLAIIEGAGGVMSPIAEDATNLDLMAALMLPVLLVAGAYLGAVSHTLTAVEAIRSRGLPLRAVVISGSADPTAPDFAETVELTRNFLGETALVAAPRGSDAVWAGALYRLLPGWERPGRGPTAATGD